MPKLDGIAMVRVLRARWPRLPVVFVTGDHSGAEGAAGLGELAAKPFESNTLSATARRAILRASLEDLLACTGAKKDNVQVLDVKQEALIIEVQRGFDEPFLQQFRQVKQADCACGTAMRNRAPVVIGDVHSSFVFQGAPSLRVMLDAEVLAVQSTPLVGANGQLLGVLSTHYSEPHRFGPAEIRVIGEACERAGQRVESLLT